MDHFDILHVGSEDVILTGSILDNSRVLYIPDTAYLRRRHIKGERSKGRVTGDSENERLEIGVRRLGLSERMYRLILTVLKETLP